MWWHTFFRDLFLPWGCCTCQRSSAWACLTLCPIHPHLAQGHENGPLQSMLHAYLQSLLPKNVMSPWSDLQKHHRREWKKPPLASLETINGFSLFFFLLQNYTFQHSHEAISLSLRQDPQGPKLPFPVSTWERFCLFIFPNRGWCSLCSYSIVETRYH